MHHAQRVHAVCCGSHEKSNTYALEHCLGWGGLLIEADEANYRLLSTRNPGRRNVTTLHAAVCDRATGAIPFYPSDGPTGSTVGYSHLMSPQQAQKQVQWVPCAPLYDLMRRAGYGYTDFFSLDVEGGEQLVLRHANLSALKVILIEDDGKNQTRQAAIQGLLQSAGLVYSHAMRLGRQRYGGWNQVFVQRSLLGGKPPSSEPACLAAVQSRCGSLQRVNGSFVSLR